MVVLTDLLQIGIGFGIIAAAHAILLPPLFGAPVPSNGLIALAVGLGLVGCLLMGRGVHRAIVRRDTMRPDIDPEHDHTMDWITRP